MSEAPQGRKPSIVGPGGKKGDKTRRASIAAPTNLTEQHRKSSNVSFSSNLAIERSRKLSALATETMKADVVASRLRLRRKSYGFSSVRGVRIVERTSQVGLLNRRPITTHMPTYQLTPLRAFHPVYVTKIMDRIVDTLFLDHKYNPETSPMLAMQIAQDIMRVVKMQDFNRYRIIAVVTIGEHRAQCYNNAISVTWDSERDRYADVNRRVYTAFLQATCFGVYLD